MTDRKIPLGAQHALTHSHPTPRDLADALAAERAPDAAELDVRRRTSNMVFWLETEALKLGLENQRERYTAGVLPEVELLSLARGELYRPLADFPRWKNRDLHAREVKHEASCAGAEQRVTYHAHPVEAVDANTWERLKAFRHATNQIAVHEWLVRSQAKLEVAVTAHTAVCTVCKKSVTRYAVKVSIQWAGRTLVREYAL